MDLLAVFCFRCLWSLSPTWQLLSASEALSGFNGRTAKDLHLNHVLHFKSFPPFKGYCGHVTSSRNDCLQGNIRSQTAEGFSWTCSWGFFASHRFQIDFHTACTLWRCFLLFLWDHKASTLHLQTCYRLLIKSSAALTVLEMSFNPAFYILCTFMLFQV